MRKDMGDFVEINMNTPPKMNIATKNRQSQKETMLNFWEVYSCFFTLKVFSMDTDKR